MYRYKVYVTRVVDGDTVDVDVDLGFGMIYKKQRVRMMGIDTPESRTRNLEEKFYGKASKAHLESIIAEGNIELQSHGKGKFGRILGDFKCNGRTLSKVMIEMHHAVEYHGQSKEDIREAHLANRRKVKI